MEKNFDDLHELQSIEREILQETIRICEKHHLCYFLIEGSLLGAIRHQGMIPWDDDIDIGMFRHDYEKFIQIAPSELDASFEVRHYKLRDDYIDCMTKITNRHRYVQSFAKEKPFVTNVWIDLFAIDGMPRAKISQIVHKGKLLYAKLWLMWSNIDWYATERKRSFWERVLIGIAKNRKIFKRIDTKKQLLKLDRIMCSIPVTENNDTVIFTSEYKFRTVLPFAAYSTGRTVHFDGMQVSIPQNAELLLTQEYGNYMRLPAQEQRYKHKLVLLPDATHGKVI